MSKKFVANQFSTVLPDGWADRSVISLVNLKTTSGFAANVVVLREEVAPHTNIEQYAQKQLAEVKAGLPDFQVIDERAATVKDLPAYQALSRFTSNGRMLQQAQTFVLKDAMIFAFTFTTAIEDFNTHIPALREIVDNLVFENDTGNF